MFGRMGLKSYSLNGVSGFDPSSISGYFFHVKADTGVLDSGGDFCTNGEDVATWEDQGPNGYDLTVPSGAAPTYNSGSAALNGIGGIDFSTGANRLRNATAVDFMPFESTVILVMELFEPVGAGVVITGDNNLGRKLTNWVKTAGVEMDMYMARNFTSRPHYTHTFGDPAFVNTLVWGASGFGSPSPEVLKNNVDVSNGGTYTEATTDTALQFGQDYVGGNGAKMYLYECIIYHGILSAEDRTAIQGYFNEKYSLTPDLTTDSEAAFSLRKLSDTYSGSAIRVRRSSDDTEQDIGFSGNDLDTATMETFTGAGDGYVTKWYDQSGNAKDVIQTANANQPQIVSTGTTITTNGKPAINFDGTAANYLKHPTSLLAELSVNEAVISCVTDATSIAAGYGDGYVVTEGDVVSPYSSNFILKGTTAESASSLWVNATVYGTAGDLTQEICGFYKTGTGTGSKPFRAARNGIYDGVETNATVNTEIGTTHIGASANGTTAHFHGTMQEIIIQKTAVNDVRLIQKAQNDYWGVY